MQVTTYVISAGLVIGLFMPALHSYAEPKTTTIRPIEDFVAQQGTFCLDQNFKGSYVDEIVDGNFVGNCPTDATPLLFVPPIANFIGQNDPRGRGASVDYAGLADHWAGGAFATTVTGRVIERPLADGRALVEVLLRTGNALTWVIEGSDFANDPLLFGYRAPDALAGPDAALGESFLEVKFTNTAPGDPLPDLIQLILSPEPGQELLSLGVSNRADGPLREPFGVPDGTPGRATGVQTGLIGNPQCGSGSPSAVADCFPVERIDLHVIGH